MIATPEFTMALPKGFLPDKDQQILAREAVRRGVPLNDIIREALLTKAREIVGGQPEGPTHNQKVA